MTESARFAKAYKADGSLPRWARQTIFNYVVHGHYPGGLLAHVIAGRLYDAALASSAHCGDIGIIARFLAIHMPECCGSNLHLESWMQQGGIEGRAADVKQR